ncbi:MAG: GHKL domain-containing protein, partial [Vibrionaceae bacterium]|nr:GHKL domain-containing protein [Vibrionaceae bacterium]
SNLTDRMATISNQLKAFTRKSDSSDVNVLDLAPIIVSARELVMPQLKASRIELIADVPHPLGKVEVNAIQVEQVLINLMTNAAQAVEDLEERKVQLSTQSFEDSIEIYIDDNGPGIDATKAEHLFEPFFTTKKNGLGLGLSISQQIIETMKGKLTVGQSPLGGARFTISLPLVSSIAKQNTKDS